MVNKLPDELDNPFDLMLYRHIDDTLPLYKALGFTPNGLTTVSLLLGLFTAYAVYHRHFLVAALTWFLSYYYDCADGKMARRYHMTSAYGDWYDHASDWVKHGALFYVLFLLLRRPSTQRFMAVAVTVLFLLLGLIAHQMSCQERFTDTSQTSQSLAFLQMLSTSADQCQRNMPVTRYFTPGTVTVYLCLLILFLGYGTR